MPNPLTQPFSPSTHRVPGPKAVSPLQTTSPFSVQVGSPLPELSASQILLTALPEHYAEVLAPKDADAYAQLAAAENIQPGLEYPLTSQVVTGLANVVQRDVQAGTSAYTFEARNMLASRLGHFIASSFLKDVYLGGKVALFTCLKRTFPLNEELPQWQQHMGAAHSLKSESLETGPSSL